MWVKNLNNGAELWNNDAAADLTAGVRGAAIAPGDLYIAFSGNFTSSSADTVVLNTGVSTFIGSLPSGYSAWDSAGGVGATAQVDTILREVLLADTGTGQIDTLAREVLLTDTSTLEISGAWSEVALTNPATLQVGGSFAEVLASTVIWTPGVRTNRTYRIR